MMLKPFKVVRTGNELSVETDPSKSAQLAVVLLVGLACVSVLVEVLSPGGGGVIALPGLLLVATYFGILIGSRQRLIAGDQRIAVEHRGIAKPGRRPHTWSVPRGSPRKIFLGRGDRHYCVCMETSASEVRCVFSLPVPHLAQVELGRECARILGVDYEERPLDELLSRMNSE